MSGILNFHIGCHLNVILDLMQLKRYVFKQHDSAFVSIYKLSELKAGIVKYTRIQAHNKT